MKKDRSAYTFLVVEDNPGDYMLLQDYLDEQFVSVDIIRATNFKQAKEKLILDNSHISLIFLDLTLPDKNGIELVEEIMKYSVDRPVIVLTGYSDISFATKSIALGVSDYLLKDDITAPMLYKSIKYNLERNKNLISLHESEKRYSDLFHLSPQPMWVYDLETLRFLDVNKAATKQYGFLYSEFITKTILDIQPAETTVELDPMINMLRSGKEEFFEGEVVHQLKNGKKIDVEIRCNVISFKNRQAVLTLANNITERKRHVEAIEVQNTKLKDIAWVQSHVVRAPLARIMGLVDLLTFNSVSEEEKTELMQNILTSAQELDNVIKEIVSKTERINLQQL